MTSLSYAVSDSATMLRRDLLHMRRNAMVTVAFMGTPIVMLLLFGYVFGGAMSLALGNTSGGLSYIDYVVPGIIAMAVGSGCGATAISINLDMSEGIIARFRTMAISRVSVLTGHVIGNVIRLMLSVGLVIGVAVLMGFRSSAGPVGWIAVIGVIAMFALALTWLSVALGLVAGTPGGANLSTQLFWLLPFVSSTFVRPESMPSGLRWFAENQPFTAVIETVRGLLRGVPVGNHLVVAVIWCAIITAVGYVWARSAFNRDPAR